MLHPSHKKFSESPNKKWRPPVLKEPENNNSSISAVFRIHKRSIRLHVKKPGFRLTFVAFQAPFSLIPLLVGWNIGGQKKNGQMPTRKKTGQSLHVFLNKCSVNVQTYKRFLFGAVLVFIIIIFFEEIFWVQNYWIFFLGIKERRLWWFCGKCWANTKWFLDMRLCVQHLPHPIIFLSVGKIVSKIRALQNGSSFLKHDGSEGKAFVG